MLRLRKLMDEKSNEPAEIDVSESEFEGTTISQPVQATTVSQEKQLKQLEDMLMEQGKQIAKLRDTIKFHTSKVATKVDSFECELLNFDVKLRNGAEQVKPKERAKIPTFDGNSSYLIFRMQFEVAIRDLDEEERKNALICSLHGPAAEVLQQFSFSERNYENLMEALELKYGNNHLSSLRQRKWQIKPHGLVELAYSDAEPVTKDELLTKMFNYAMRDKKLRSELEFGENKSAAGEQGSKDEKKFAITKDPKIPPTNDNVLHEIEHFTEKVVEIIAEENKRNVLLREILEETSRASPLHLADKLNKLLDEDEQQNASQRMPGARSNGSEKAAPSKYEMAEESNISTVSDVIHKLQEMTERLLEINDEEKKYNVDQHEQPEEIGDESWAPPGSTIV